MKAHPLQLISRIFSLAVFLFALIYFSIRIFSYDISLNNRFLYFQAPFLFIVSFAVLSYIIYLVGSYFTTKIKIEKDYIIYQNNFFIKKRIALSYENIHNYSIKCSLLHRLMGAKRLLINSGSHLEGAEIDITMKRRTISLIEKNINHCCQADKNGDKNLQIENKWLLLYSILIPSKWLKIVGYSLSALTVIALALTQNRELSYSLLILLYIGAILLSIIINSIFIINKFHNFNLQKISNTLVISYGFFNHVKRFVLNNKINGLLVKQNLLNKFTKTYHPFIYAAGYKNLNEEFSFPLFPIIHKKALSEVIKEFLPLFEIKEEKTPPPTKAAKYYLLYPLINYNLIALPLCLVFIWVGEYLAIPIYLFFNSVIFTDRQLAFKNSFICSNSSVFSAQRGGLMTKRLFCRVSSLQAIRHINSVFNEKKNIKKIKIFVKSVKNKAFSLGYMDEYNLPLKKD
ncbi:MAG: hypothetical protein ACOCWI_05305 [Bacillota bacterium]